MFSERAICFYRFVKFPWLIKMKAQAINKISSTPSVCTAYSTAY